MGAREGRCGFARRRLHFRSPLPSSGGGATRGLEDLILGRPQAVSKDDPEGAGDAALIPSPGWERVFRRVSALPGASFETPLARLLRTKFLEVGPIETWMLGTGPGITRKGRVSFRRSCGPDRPERSGRGRQPARKGMHSPVVTPSAVIPAQAGIHHR